MEECLEIKINSLYVEFKIRNRIKSYQLANVINVSNFFWQIAIFPDIKCNKDFIYKINLNKILSIPFTCETLFNTLDKKCVNLDASLSTDQIYISDQLQILSLKEKATKWLEFSSKFYKTNEISMLEEIQHRLLDLNKENFNENCLYFQTVFSEIGVPTFYLIICQICNAQPEKLKMFFNVIANLLKSSKAKINGNEEENTSDNKSQTENEDESQTENEDESQTENEDESQTENEDENQTENEDENQTENEDENQTENEDESQTENEDESQTENEDESQTENEDESQTENEDESQTENEDESQTENEDESQTENEDESQTENEDESQTENEDESQTENEDENQTENEDENQTENEDENQTENEDENQTENEDEKRNKAFIETNVYFESDHRSLPATAASNEKLLEMRKQSNENPLQKFANFVLKYSYFLFPLQHRKRALFYRVLYNKKLIDRSKINLFPFTSDSGLFYLTGKKEVDSNPDPISVILRNDDIDSLTALFNMNFNFDINSYVNDSTFETCELNEKINYVCYSAFYGASKCFDFLITNKVKVDSDLVLFAVAGGDAHIIHQCELLGLNFNRLDCVKVSIQYHRNEVCEWLLETKFNNNQSVNYFELENVCLNYCNFQMFFSFVEKGFLTSYFVMFMAKFKIKLLYQWMKSSNLFFLIKNEIDDHIKCLLKNYDRYEEEIKEIFQIILEMMEMNNISLSDDIILFLKNNNKYGALYNMCSKYI